MGANKVAHYKRQARSLLCLTAYYRRIGFRLAGYNAMLRANWYVAELTRG